MIFFEDIGSDWTPLHEIENDSILAYDTDGENVPPIENNQELDINIIPATSSSSDLEEVTIHRLENVRPRVHW